MLVLLFAVFILAVSFAAGAAATVPPLIRLHLPYGTSDVLVGVPVSFSVGFPGSLLYGFPHTNASFQIDVGDANTPPVSLAQGLASYVYTTPGIRLVSLITNGGIDLNQSTVLSRTSFNVLLTSNCYQFGMQYMASNLSLGGNVNYSVTIYSPGNWDTWGNSLTQSFAALGEVPLLIVSNWTQVFQINLQTNTDINGLTYYVASIPVDYFFSRSPLTAQIQSSGTVINGCRIGSSIFDISISGFRRLSFGRYIIPSNADGIALGQAILDENFIPNNIHFTQDRCTSNNVLAYFGGPSVRDDSTSTSSRLGSLVMISSSFFENNDIELRNLLLPPSDATTSPLNSSLCLESSLNTNDNNNAPCAGLNIISAFFLDWGSIFFLTSKGIIIAPDLNDISCLLLKSSSSSDSSFEYSSATLSNASSCITGNTVGFFSVPTGIAAVDEPSIQSFLYRRISVSTSIDCYRSNSSFLYVLAAASLSRSAMLANNSSITATTQALAQTAIIFSSANLGLSPESNLAAGSSSDPTILQLASMSITGLDETMSSYSLIAAMHDSSRHIHLLLIGRPLYQGDHVVADDAQLHFGCVLLAQNASVLDPSDPLYVGVLYRFPNSTILRGAAFHANTLDLYVFGNEIWTSVDGGVFFRRIYGPFSDPSLIPSSSATETVVSFRSSISKQSMIFVTTNRRVLYSIAGADNLAMILAPVRSTRFITSSSFEVLFSASGMPHSFEMELNSSINCSNSTAGTLFNYLNCSTNATNEFGVPVYPSGFLQDAHGTLRSPASIFRKLALPVQSAIQSDDLAFNVTLGVYFIAQNTVRLFAFKLLNANSPDGFIGAVQPGVDFRGFWEGWSVRQIRPVSSSSATVFSSFVSPPTFSANSLWNDGGMARIDSISDDLLRADCILQKAFVAEDKSRSPALQSALSVVGLPASSVNAFTSPPHLNDLAGTQSTVANVSLILLQSPSSSWPGWLASDLGKTIVVHGGSILITSVVNATYSVGAVFGPLRSVAAASPGDWQMYDFNFKQEQATVSFAQSLSTTTLTPSSSETTVEVTISPGYFSFQPIHEGMVLATSTATGFVQNIISNSTVILGGNNGTFASSLNAGTWSLFSLNREYVYGTDPRDFPMRSWALTVDDCRYCPDLTPNFPNGGVTYLDLDAVSNFTDSFTVNECGINIDPYWMEHNYSAMVAFSSDTNMLISVDATVMQNMAVLSYDLNANVQDDSIQIASVMTYRPVLNSLSCDWSPFQYRFITGCHPLQSADISIPVDMNDYLYNDLVDDYGLSVMIDLPVNYRPPSSLGNAIPITSNIYNADPSQPKYHNYYRVSQNTGVYKQCKGAASRSECQCSDEQMFSQDVKDSDCIARVMRTYYQLGYAPQLMVGLEGQEQPYLGEYDVQDVNNRVDFCSSSGQCASALNESVQINITNNDLIVWKGSGLYHMRVTITHFTYCNLSTEFLVYVTNEDIDSRAENIIMTNVGFVFGVGIFVLYLLHSYGGKKT